MLFIHPQNPSFKITECPNANFEYNSKNYKIRLQNLVFIIPTSDLTSVVAYSDFKLRLQIPNFRSIFKIPTSNYVFKILTANPTLEVLPSPIAKTLAEKLQILPLQHARFHGWPARYF